MNFLFMDDRSYVTDYLRFRLEFTVRGILVTCMGWQVWQESNGLTSGCERDAEEYTEFNSLESLKQHLLGKAEGNFKLISFDY